MTKATTIAIGIIFIAILLNFPTTQSQDEVIIKTSDRFNIPNQAATIQFGFNGSCSSAILEDNTWIFKNLQLDHPPNYAGIDLTQSKNIGDLRISAQNSNITIWAYLMFYYTLPVHSLVYFAQGTGTQTINLGLSASEASDASEWSVIVDNNVFLAKGRGWELLADDTIIVEGQSGNITVAHFELGSLEKNLFFYANHSVAILTAVVLITLIIVCLAIRFKKKKKVIKTLQELNQTNKHRSPIFHQ